MSPLSKQKSRLLDDEKPRLAEKETPKGKGKTQEPSEKLDKRRRASIAGELQSYFNTAITLDQSLNALTNNKDFPSNAVWYIINPTVRVRLRNFVGGVTGALRVFTLCLEPVLSSTSLR